MSLLDRVRTARVEAEACYCRDDLVCQLCGAVMGAEGELATWLLDHPEAVEAVEVLRAYGVALRRDDWGYEVDEVGERLAKLADRLATEGES